MKPLIKRALVGAAATVALLGTFSAPAQAADLPYTPADSDFAEAAASAGGLINTAVNLRAGLPSASGKNSASFKWIVRLKGY